MNTEMPQGVTRNILLSELDPSIESQIAWFRHMQETLPIRYRPEYNLWELFRYSDIQQVLLDHATFSISHALPEGFPCTLARSDPPEHRQLRSLVSKAFTPRRVEEFTPHLIQTVDEFLAPARDTGKMDIASQFTFLLPFGNLLMKEKTVALPYEDPVTYGVNAAKPVVDSLSAAERERIELLITCTESGIDFGKSLSTYIHHYLGLNRNCRLFEIKQACYSGTAGFQMAINFIQSQASPGAKALVVATDVSRLTANTPEDGVSIDVAFAEPSIGAGAVALLVGENADVFAVDFGANGNYGYEVMDMCRPVPQSEVGDVDLSLLSYMDCCENAFLQYQKRVIDVDYWQAFHYLAFHTPFGGMVKGAHRSMMRKMTGVAPREIEADFQQRVLPGMLYCQRVGNIMGATVFLSLASTIDHGEFEPPGRISCFSYGSGCCSEFYSGVVTAEGQKRQQRFQIEHQLNERYQLSMDEYEFLLQENGAVKFGARDIKLDFPIIPGALSSYRGKPRLYLEEIRDFHRQYRWGL